MKHYVYSDPHFFHKNIIHLVKRPFETVEEMNSHLIAEYKKIVTSEDKVYFLGDIGMGKIEDIKSIVEELPGYKILIMGNHDRQTGKTRDFWLEAGFQEVSKNPIMIHKLFILSHEPLEMSKDMPYFNIHGHIHANLPISSKHYNVSVENTGYKPVDVSKLTQLIKKQKKEYFL